MYPKIITRFRRDLGGSTIKHASSPVRTSQPVLFKSQINLCYSTKSEKMQPTIAHMQEGECVNHDYIKSDWISASVERNVM